MRVDEKHTEGFGLSLSKILSQNSADHLHPSPSRKRLASEAPSGLILPGLRASHTGSEDHPDKGNTSLPFGVRGKGCVSDLDNMWGLYVLRMNIKIFHFSQILSFLSLQTLVFLDRYPMQEPTLNIWGHSFLQSKHPEFILMGGW